MTADRETALMHRATSHPILTGKQWADQEHRAMLTQAAQSIQTLTQDNQ